MTDATYKAKLDIADIKTKAAEIERTLTEAFKQAGQKGSADSGMVKVLQEQAKAATEVQRQQTALARAIQESENGATATTKAAAQERVQAAKAESQERIQAAKASSAAQIEEERRVTAQVKAELQAQAQATKQKAASQGATGGIGGALLGAAAGYFTVQGARYVAQQAMQFAELGTQIRRTEASFNILSGGVQKANQNLIAIKEAGGGAISTMEGMQLANQSLALGLAKTPEGFGNIVRAGREISLVSPVIHDVQSAISELGLASANLSYRRLDQLGLTVTEVKAKMKELQSQNSSLDDSSAFLAASLELLDKKYGDVLKSAEAQASGVEKLKVAFSDLIGELSKTQAVDGFFNAIAAGIQRTRVAVGSNDPGALKSTIDDLANRVKPGTPLKINDYVQTTYNQEDVANIHLLKDAYDQLNSSQTVNVGILDESRAKINDLIQKANGKEKLTNADANAIREITTAYEAAALARKNYEAASPLEQIAKNQKLLDAQIEARQLRITDSVSPITKLNDSLKDIGLENFFQKINDGLSNSAELTATATNHLQDYRNELEKIAKAVGDQNGIATPEQVIRVDAINAQINSLTEANKLLDEFKKKQIDDAGGSAVNRAFTDLNNLLPGVRSNVDGVYAGISLGANRAGFDVEALAEKIGRSGQVTPADQAIIDEAKVTQATQALEGLTRAQTELNSAALDAVPGVEGISNALDGYYEKLASGQSLSSEETDSMYQMIGAADALGGSTSALADLQRTLGFEFFDNNEYAGALVNQIANLEGQYASGKIGADQFAGGMATLKTELYNTLVQAGALTPHLREVLALLFAIQGAGGIGGGQVQGPPKPGSGNNYLPGGGLPGVNADYIRGRKLAEEALAREKLRAETSERNQTRAEQARLAKEAEAGSKKAANAAEREFENAAKATEKAFESVAKNFEDALKKVPGLFSASEVTQGQLDQAKAGIPQNFADDFIRRFADLALNNKKSGVSKEDVKAALGNVGISGSDDPKALLAQLKDAWYSGVLFSNKDNLKLINAEAVKAATDLQTRAKEGNQNILDYFGASIDAIKEKFKAGDPQIVGAVAAELGDSNDKNIRELGESLKTGGQKMIDKVLELAQASIDKSVAGLDLGDGVSFGGGGSGGGIGGISGKIQTVVDKAKEKVAAVTAATGDYLSGVNLTGQNADLSGAFKITSFDISGTSPLSGAFKITSFDTTALPTIAPVEVKAKIVMDEGGASTASFTDALAKNFENPATRAILAGIGSKASSALVYGFASLAVYGDLVTSFTNEIDTQFKSATTEGVASATGAALAGFIDRGFEGHTPVVAGYVNSVATSFGNSANRAIEAKIGLDIAAEIEKGIGFLYVGTDYTSNFIKHMQEIFGNESNIGNYQAIGDLIVEQIEGQIGKADLVTTLQSKISAAFAPKRTVVAPGAFLETSAFDFTGMAESATQGLSTAFGTQTSFYEAMGDTAAVYIGYGFGDHDFSGAANNAISQLNSGFMNEANVTQLVTIGNSLADNIHDGFTGRIQSQDWLGTIISAIVASVMNGLADSLKGTK